MSSFTQNGQAPSNTSIKLTGGVEIECLLLTLYSNEEAAYPNGSFQYTYLAQKKIYEALSIPLRVRCVACMSTFYYRLPLHKPKSPSADIDDDDEDFTKWNISYDETLDLTAAECAELDGKLACHSAPIEIKSRVIPLTESFDAAISKSNPTHTHKLTYRDEIGAVYSCLHSSFNKPSGDFAKNSRLVVNETASTHIHIGSAYHGFPLDTVKNVMSVVVASEMAIDTVHAADRITGSDRLSKDVPWSAMSGFAWDNKVPSAYNSPWSQHLSTSAYKHYQGESSEQRSQKLKNGTQPKTVYPATDFPRNPELKLAAQKCDVGSWLTLIEGAKSIQDLTRFQFGVAHASTINLSNLREQRPLAGPTYSRWDGKMTIEFRQHGGTLQSKEVLNWIGVLGALFKYANTTKRADVQTACLKNWSNPNFTILDLLKLLGFRSQDDIFRHYASVLGCIPSRKPYADVVEQQEIITARTFGRGDPFASIMKRLIRSRAATIHPDTVRERVMNKFKLGGYGQFSESYLEQCKPVYGEMPKYLTLGFCPPWSQYEA